MSVTEDVEFDKKRLETYLLSVKIFTLLPQVNIINNLTL